MVLPESTRAIYPFQSHYLTLSSGHKMHYIDEGPEDGEVLVFAHGYPTWSFAFRAFVVYYAALGYRCLAMDHVGYGLSDKPAERRYHTLPRHIDNLTELFDALALHDITFVVENWGGPLVLGYAIHHLESIKRLAVINSWVFQDTYANRLHPVIRWVTTPGVGELVFGTLNFVLAAGIQRWTQRTLSSTVLQAYKAPFRDSRSRAALVQFPRMINTTPQHPSAEFMREIESALGNLRHIPTLVIWGEDDPLLTPDVAQHWKTMVPRVKGPMVIANASHLLSEDAPEQVIQHLDHFLELDGGHTA